MAGEMCSGTCVRWTTAAWRGFNEAPAQWRGKSDLQAVDNVVWRSLGFNEAPAQWRGKYSSRTDRAASAASDDASMRPPRNGGGNRSRMARLVDTRPAEVRLQ